jgi:hypothetical protein
LAGNPGPHEAHPDARLHAGIQEDDDVPLAARHGSVLI